MTNPREWQNCAIEGERVRPCWALSDVLEEAGKGIRYIQTMKLTGENGRGFVAVFGGAHKKRGLVLNYCPFCAEALTQPRTPESAVGVPITTTEHS